MSNIITYPSNILIQNVRLTLQSKQPFRLKMYFRPLIKYHFSQGYKIHFQIYFQNTFSKCNPYKPVNILYRNEKQS